MGGLLIGSGAVTSLYGRKGTLYAASPVLQLEEQTQPDSAKSALGSGSDHVTFYQYRTCPFCCKVRAFLDYYGLPYEEVEVNPLFKREIKFSKRKAVPFVVVDHIQIFDSSVIVSVLRSSMLGSRGIRQTLSCYPEIMSKDRKGNDIVERGNKYNIMYGTTEDLEVRHDEIRWRQWVDDTLIHDLAPNIYRTLPESFRSFRYISAAGNFTTVERYGAQIVGAILMYFIGRRLKKK
jgi:microsomal prostaglandin-E synthase 2